MFPVKDKNGYKSCVIYKRNFSCGSRYIGESKRTVEDRWNEHTVIIQLTIQNHRNIFFFFSVCCIATDCFWQLTFDKKQKSCIKLIHLVTEDGLHDQKTF